MYKDKKALEWSFILKVIFDCPCSQGCGLHLRGSGGQIDPNIDNIDTNVCIDIEQYECNKINTLFSVSLLHALLLVHQRGNLVPLLS